MIPSHPTRVRGLKPVPGIGIAGHTGRTHAGAWIETINDQAYNYILKSTSPHAGAWIENKKQLRVTLTQLMSHPTRVRGLKLNDPEKCGLPYHVAPTRVRGLKPSPRHWHSGPHWSHPTPGAWIETSASPRPACRPEASHPTRVRGLKQGHQSRLRLVSGVAPHAGAWIETRSHALSRRTTPSGRTPRGCVD